VPILQVDAGHLFSDDLSPTGFADDVRLKNEWVLRGYDALGAVAANVSFRDLPFAASLMKEAGYGERAKEFPIIERLVAANITPTDKSVRPFKPYVIREIQGKRLGAKPLRIGILGLTHLPQVAAGGRERRTVGGFTISDPFAMAARYVPELRAKCDLVVVLAYMDQAETGRLGALAPGIDVIITANQYGPLRPASEAGDAVVVYATNQTKYLGELRLYRKEGAPEAGVANYLHRDVPLDEAVPDDPAALKITVAAREAFTRAQRAAVGAGGSPGPGSVDPLERQRAVLARQSRFAGSESCASCHEREYAIWKASGHAHAFRTLEEKGQHLDQSCTQCHTVGQGFPGGFRNASLTPRLADVQCESCHTAGKGHLTEPGRPYGQVATPAACLTCHTKENSPEFDFARYWEKIKHGPGATVATAGASAAP
jgi:hypothetical protein